MWEEEELDGLKLPSSQRLIEFDKLESEESKSKRSNAYWSKSKRSRVV